MLKSNIQKVFNSLGYKIEKIDSYYSDNYFFKKILTKVKDYTMTNPKRIFYLYLAVNHVIKNNIKGDMVECGVWKGGSIMTIALTLIKNKIKNKNIFLYDTFSGMSKPTNNDYLYSDQSKLAINLIENDEYLKCKANISEVKKNIFKTNYPKKRFKFVVGDVKYTLKKKIPRKISLLRLDTDWYESTKQELHVLFPKLSNGGILIIDDYKTWGGCKKAVDEYFKNRKNIFFLSIDNEALIGIKF